MKYYNEISYYNEMCICGFSFVVYKSYDEYPLFYKMDTHREISTYLEIVRQDDFFITWGVEKFHLRVQLHNKY